MRLFISIEIPDEIKNKIKKVQEGIINIDGIRLSSLNLMHITLKFLGEVPEEKLPEIEKALSEINFSKFNIDVKDIGFFPSESFVRVIWIGSISKEQNELAEKINETLLPLGFKKDGFTGHITIARVFKKIDAEKIKEKCKDLNLGSFTADKFCLVKSTLQRPSPIHEILKEFTLV